MALRSASVSAARYTFEVKAVDKAGNINQDTITFVVNLSPLLGSEYLEAAVVAAVLIIVALVIIVYVARKRGKR